MDEVAAAAGVTKRTLYAWHQDKEALFRACIIVGAERYPRFAPKGHGATIRAALERYVIELHVEITREDSLGMGALFLREAGEFPELAASVQRGYFDYVISPLVSWLRQHGAEEEGLVDKVTLFAAMALSPLLNTLLMGTPLPDTTVTANHARQCVSLFLEGVKIL